MKGRRFGHLVQLVGLGWYIAFCIILGVVGGVWLDGRLGSTPLFTLIGLILGTVIAFYGVYRMVAPLLEMDNKEEDGGA